MIDAPTYPIRTASLSDADAVSTLLVASYSILLPPHYSGETLRSALPHMTKANPQLLASATFYVAEAGPGHLVGCGGWTAARPGSGEIVEGEAHIRHFATHPDSVRRGVGATLLARCFSDAQHLSIRKLYCLSTLGAEPFYEAFGFKK